MKQSEIFRNLGEFFLAGLFEEKNKTMQARIARGIRRTLENLPLPEYHGEKLYPSGRPIWESGGMCCTFHYSSTFAINGPALRKKIEESLPENSFERGAALAGVAEAEFLQISCISPDFASGRGWTHAVLDYERVLEEGFAGIRERILAAESGNPEFYRPLLEVADAMIGYAGRCAEKLEAEHAPEELRRALGRVPEHPPRNFQEAVAAFNFFWYFDGSDSGGRVDRVLSKYSPPDDAVAEELFHALWKNFDSCDGWHVLLDSKLSLSIPAIRAQKGLRRPNSGILVDGETPDSVWDAIFDSWGSNNPSPALYSRKNYAENVEKVLGLSKEDSDWFCYGGCTELMVQGRSRTGSLEAGIHVLKILVDTGLDFRTWEDFYEAVFRGIDRKTAEMAEEVRMNLNFMAACRPNPVRTLFFRDCLERGLDFNAGGTRYYTGVINVVGLVNFINSLYTVKCAFEGKLSGGIPALAEALEKNYPDENFRREILRLPKFGNDAEEVDSLAADAVHRIFSGISSRSGANYKFTPGVIMHITYIPFGKNVGASPDGRGNGDPLADSFGAMQGTDRNGPTALLNSTLVPVQSEGLGTLVLNLRLNKSLFGTVQGRSALKALLLSYFERGGLQIQPTVNDSETLLKAAEHPDDFPNLIIRIGGYSEYFSRLSPELRREVIKRTEHTL